MAPFTTQIQLVFLADDVNSAVAVTLWTYDGDVRRLFRQSPRYKKMATLYSYELLGKG
ncbi:hypothetical protein DPMN_076193 [Dreissena polymorpha]|uniref:Uncharacterized protein n=1 Tax=Dreissena polymorpha TaxID=45954 RepID=A0A9D3YLX3_DREPO|nr:hypothetical protein DPMN_076193 [Dreissena polymorpha]